LQNIAPRARGDRARLKPNSRRSVRAVAGLQRASGAAIAASSAVWAAPKRGLSPVLDLSLTSDLGLFKGLRRIRDTKIRPFRLSFDRPGRRGGLSPTGKTADGRIGREIVRLGGGSVRILELRFVTGI